MRLKPQGSGSGQWIDSGSTPPRGFIAVSVEFAMMPPAQRDGELIADLTSECASLRKAEVVGITRPPAADKTRLLSDMPDVLAIPHPARLRERQGALVDRFRLFWLLSAASIRFCQRLRRRSSDIDACSFRVMRSKT